MLLVLINISDMNGRELRFVMAMLLLTATVAAQETRSFRTVMEIPVTSVKISSVEAARIFSRVS